MEGVIERGSDTRVTQVGAGNHGAAVFDESEVGDNLFYGSKTIISVNDAPPLPEKFEPKVAPVKPVVKPTLSQPPGTPTALSGLLARMKPATPVAALAAPVTSVATTVAPTPDALQQARSQLDLLKRIGVTK